MEKKIINKIEANMKKISGEKFLTHFLNNYNYDLKFDRYINLKSFEFLNLKNNKWLLDGYLLNIGLKYFNTNNKETLSEEKIKEIFLEIISLSKNLSELLFNNENINFNPYMIKGKLKESLFTRLYFDRIVSFNQYDYKFFRKFIIILITNINLYVPHKFKINQNINKVIENILEKVRYRKGIIKFTSEELFSNLSRDELSLFKKIFIKDSKEINKEYTHPFFIQYINTFEKPLIKVGEEYIFISRNLSMYSLYLSVLQYLNSLEQESFKKANLETLVGRCLEIFIRDELLKLSDNFSYGYDEENNEYDLLYIKNKKAIIFEIKKKGFINKSLEGRCDSIFNDFSKGYIKGQDQLLKRKNYLKNKEKLKIYENIKKRGLKFEKEIDYQNIQFISITLDNFNSLGEKHFFNRLLEYFINNKEHITIGVVNSQESKELQEYDKKLKKSLNDLLDNIKLIADKYEIYMNNEECKQRDDPNFTWDFSFNKNLLDTWTLDVSTLFSLINYYRINDKKENLIDNLFESMLSVRNSSYNTCSNFDNLYYKILALNQREKLK